LITVNSLRPSQLDSVPDCCHSWVVPAVVSSVVGNLDNDVSDATLPHTACEKWLALVKCETWTPTTHDGRAAASRSENDVRADAEGTPYNEV